MEFTVDGCVAALSEMGYVFTRREDGSVSVRQPAKREPRAAAMMNFLAKHKEEVREVVRAREEVQMRLIPKLVDEGSDEKDQEVIVKNLDKAEGFDQIQAADGSVLPEPDAAGIVRLVRVPPEVAFAAGDLISDGKAELIGNVIYRRRSNVFDLTYRVFEL